MGYSAVGTDDHIAANGDTGEHHAFRADEYIISDAYAADLCIAQELFGACVVTQNMHPGGP